MIDKQTDLRRPKVLIVDDNPVVLLALSKKLTAGGYRVTTAADGSTAINELRNGRPDLVLLDIQFPPDPENVGMRWDGFRLLEWFKRVDGDRATPVVMMTTGDPAVFRQKALNAGARDFLPKPIAPATLMGTVAEVVGPGAVPAPVAVPAGLPATTLAPSPAPAPAFHRETQSVPSTLQQIASLFSGLPVELEWAK